MEKFCAQGTGPECPYDSQGLFNTLIKSVLLYGTEIWAIKSKNEKKKKKKKKKKTPVNRNEFLATIGKNITTVKKNKC